MTVADTSLPLHKNPPSDIGVRRQQGKKSAEVSVAPLPERQPIIPLKIALLGYRSHPFVGGQGIYVKYLSRALVQLGHSVDVFSGPPYPDLAPGVNLIKVPSLNLFDAPNHIRALRFRHLRSFTDTFEWWSMLTGGFAEPYTFGRRVVKKLQGSDYDIIHDNQSLSFALLDLQKAGLIVTSTIHHPIHRDRDIALRAAEKWGDRLLIRRWYSFLSMQEKVTQALHHVTTVSRTSQNDIATFFKRSANHTPVIANGVDTETFCPQENISRIPQRIITTSSSDQALKGLRFLIEAIGQLKPGYPNIHLRIIGQLKEGGSSESLIRRLALHDNITCVSGISTRALVEEYARSSIAVCPSLYEGFGLPVAEAMACGLPVITSDGGALPEVAGKAAIVVPAGSSDAIAKEIATLFSQAKNAQDLGNAARRHILRRFSWQKVAIDLSHYYQDIIARANP